MAEGYHEENLPQEVREFHRMVQSVIEELQAVDWYNQRAAVTKDPELKAIVEHNRDEEIEHACMGLEWLRRKNSRFDQFMKEFLFTGGPLTKLEAEGKPGDEREEEGSLGLKGLK